MPDFIERHSGKIKGVTSCFDRIVLTGTIPGICYAEGMMLFLTSNGIRIFDYPQWALPLREQIRQNAETIAAQNGLAIDFIRKKDFRKEQRIQDIIVQRGSHPGLVLRIETTVNDVTFFKHHRRVEHRNGTSEIQLAPLQKTIYSLNVLAELMCASNRRYIDFISAIDDPSSAQKDIEKISKPVSDNDRSYRGFNLFNGDDLDLFEAVVRGEFNISGLSNRRIRKHLAGKTANQISRMLKRLHMHGLIKKIGRTYKYYLTKFGQRIITTALKTRELFVIPSLRGILAY